MAFLRICAIYNTPDLVTGEDPATNTEDDGPYPCLYCEMSFKTENMATVHLNLCKNRLLPKPKKVHSGSEYISNNF